CPETCRRAFCGDGYVRAGFEECDDGNDFADDGCLPGCRTATCGDGYVRFGVEECDPGDPDQAANCSDDCGITEGCGDVDASGSVVVRDAREILFAAVGLRSGSPHEACDLDGNGRVSVIDASHALRVALGLSAELGCPPPRRVVFYLAEPVAVGALQFDVAYDPAAVAFSSHEVAHTCVSLAPSAYTAFNDRPEAERLSMAFVAIAGVEGPRDLARCGYLAKTGGGPPSFVIEVLDASSPAIETLSPFPRVAYRFE
ncbi:MAG TPA: DUF4215 domain-containing protein, partial [Candidatus Binatia bacterium]|nr:DUF4215 domain-containing protein [Candidatus Binatia bacterium]